MNLQSYISTLEKVAQKEALQAIQSTQSPRDVIFEIDESSQEKIIELENQVENLENVLNELNVTIKYLSKRIHELESMNQKLTLDVDSKWSDVARLEKLNQSYIVLVRFWLL